MVENPERPFSDFKKALKNKKSFYTDEKKISLRLKI